MSTVKIEGIFFDDLNELFDSTLKTVSDESELTSEELAEKLHSKFDEIVDIFDSAIIDFYLNNNKYSLQKFITIHSKNQKDIVKANEDSFYYFILYVNACVVLYEKCCKAIARKKMPSRIIIGLSLYGLILRRSQQIVTMLLDGYIDGAMMIWRSMYEYVVTLVVIATENSDELANRYFSHSFKNSKKKAISYKNNYKELKFKAPPKKADKIIESEELKLSELYGKEFLDNEYGWADTLFPGKQKANLRNLEDRVKLNRYRPYYLLCTEHAHSNFNGFKDYMIGNKIILPRLIRPEIKHKAFIDPMQFTISILHEVTDYMIFEFSADHEYKINSEFLTKVFKLMQNTFGKK